MSRDKVLLSLLSPVTRSQGRVVGGLLLQEPVEEQVGADDDGVADVDNQLVERHHLVERDGPVIPGVQAGSVQDQGKIWPAVKIFFLLIFHLHKIFSCRSEQRPG